MLHRRVVLLATTLLIAGCKVYYAPNMQFVPMMEKKGELQGNLGPRSFQIGYSPANQWGFIANGNYESHGLFSLTDGKTSNFTIDRRGIDIGIGRYSHSGKRGGEFFAGLGYGSVEGGYTDETSRTREQSAANFRKIFLQPDVSWGRGGSRNALSARLEIISFYDQTGDFANRFGSSTTTFFQPAYTYSLSQEPLMFNVQTQLNLALGGKERVSHFSLYSSALVLNFTVGFRIGVARESK